jgi:phage shock protein E
MTFYQLRALVRDNSTNYILVDVRTPAEYRAGHIPTAVLIPYDTIADNPPTADKNALIILYCRSGSRAGIAYNTLSSMGYTNLVNFGAVSSWKDKLVTGGNP